MTSLLGITTGESDDASSQLLSLANKHSEQPQNQRAESPLITNMVRKDFEDDRSPTLSCMTTSTIGSDSHDGDYFKAQNQRLGRVIEDDTGPPHMPTLEVEARQEAISLKDEALKEAIRCLQEIAAMDSSDYQEQLVDNRLKTVHHSDLRHLTQSIHRFHAVVANLTKDYDDQTSEIVKLQSELHASKDRICRLESVVSKLHKRNTKLQKRNKSDKSLVEKLVEQVHKLAKREAKNKEERDFFETAHKLRQHELVLTRERCDSNNFSDLDGLQELETRSVSSSFSNASCVTDDGIATVKFPRERTHTWSHPDKTATMDIAEDDDGPLNISQGPVTTEVPVTPARSAIADSNPFAIFMSPKQPAQPYKLSFEAPFDMQFCVIELTKHQSLISDGTEPPSATEKAFFVCGYHGFDASVNVKPGLGARILEIGNQPIDPSWTAQDLEEYVHSQGKTTSIKFRKDSLDKPQKKALQEAIHEQEILHPTEYPAFLKKRSHMGGDKAGNFLDFLHLGGGSSSEPKVEEAKTTCSKHDESNPKPNVMSSFWKIASTPKKQDEVEQEVVSFEDRDATEATAFPITNEEKSMDSPPVVGATTDEVKGTPTNAMPSFWKTSSTPAKAEEKQKPVHSEGKDAKDTPLPTARDDKPDDPSSLEGPTTGEVQGNTTDTMSSFWKLSATPKKQKEDKQEAIRCEDKDAKGISLPNTSDQKEPSSVEGSTTKEVKENPIDVISSFWKLSSTPKKQKEEKQALCFEDKDTKRIALPTKKEGEAKDPPLTEVSSAVEEKANPSPTPGTTQAQGRNKPKTCQAESSEPSETKQTGSSTTNQQAAEAFKSSMKNMGKLFSFQ